MSITNLASFFFHQIREAELEADRVYEPVIGVVTDNKDPDKLMRVKVKFPTLSAQDTTWWVPVVSLGAGKDRGWFFLPEVNDEVLVVFEHGDINHPLVIGALWNGTDKPPEGEQSTAKKSMTSRAGSKITLDDDKGEITIEDGGGKGIITFKAADNKLLIEAKQGDVVIQCPKGTMNVIAEQGLTLTATANLDIRGDQQVNISGQATTIKASGMMAVSGGQTSINPGGTAAAATASTSPAEVADPIGS